MVTDNYEYMHPEGKSPTLCILDEAQYQDMEHFGRVHQTMMATKGKVKIFGIAVSLAAPMRNCGLIQTSKSVYMMMMHGVRSYSLIKTAL